MGTDKEVVILNTGNADVIAERLRKLLSGKRLRIDRELEGSSESQLTPDPATGEVHVYRDGAEHTSIWMHTQSRHYTVTAEVGRPAMFAFGADFVEIDQVTPNRDPLYSKFTVLGDL